MFLAPGSVGRIGQPERVRHRYTDDADRIASIFSVPDTTGLWFLPGTAYGECFQEITGASATTPAGAGDPIGTYHCLVTGKYLTAPTTDRRPILTTDGSLWWAEWDLIDDLLRSPTNEFTMTSSWFLSGACEYPSGGAAGSNQAGQGLINGSTNYMLVTQRQDIKSSVAVVRGSSMSPSFGVITASASGAQAQDVASLNAVEWSSDAEKRFLNGAVVATNLATGFTTQTLAGGAYLGFTSNSFARRTWGAIWLNRNPADNEEALINSLLAERSGFTL